MAPGDGALAELCAVPDADVVPLGAGVADGLPDDAVAVAHAALALAEVAEGWGRSAEGVGGRVVHLPERR